MSAKVTLPTFRINPAALGRRLAATILKAREAELSPEQFTDTVCAVFESCISADFTPSVNNEIDQTILDAEQAEIEKSVRRSAAARKAAERRRQLREQSSKVEETIVIETQPEVTEVSTVTSPEQGTKKRRRRNRRRKKNHNVSPSVSENVAPGVAARFHGDIGPVGGLHADNAGCNLIGDRE